MGRRSDQIQALVAHLRTFCTEPGWPSGNLNFPRPMFTEKAFPENEVVILPAVSHRDGEQIGFRLQWVYQRRFGRRVHGEIGVPLESLGVVEEKRRARLLRSAGNPSSTDFPTPEIRAVAFN